MIKTEIRKIKVFEVTVSICLIIVTCFASVALFSWMKRHNNPALDYVDSKVTELEASISRKIKESEVVMLQELLTHLKERDRRDVVEVSELVEQAEEEVVDSVPCCGGEDNLVNIDSTEDISRVEGLEHLPLTLLEEQMIQVQEFKQELLDFKAGLDEEGLLELELRKERTMESWDSLTEENKPALEEVSETSVLAHMLVERMVLESINRGRPEHLRLTLEEIEKLSDDK